MHYTTTSDVPSACVFFLGPDVCSRCWSCASTPSSTWPQGVLCGAFPPVAFCFYSVSDVHQQGGAARGSYHLFPLQASVVIHHGWQTETRAQCSFQERLLLEGAHVSFRYVCESPARVQGRILLGKILPFFFLLSSSICTNDSHFI